MKYVVIVVLFWDILHVTGNGNINLLWFFFIFKLSFEMTYSIFSSKGFRDQAKFIFMMGPEQTGMGQLLFLIKEKHGIKSFLALR